MRAAGTVSFGSPASDRENGWGRGPIVDANARLMIFAPHPDDESLGCGILLQEASRTGAAIRVIYATDGENNPWPQRAIYRKWRLTAADRQHWAKLRRAEAIAALEILGVSARCARFLRLPDQGLSALYQGDPAVVGQLRDLINDWAPTDLIAPDLADTHADHRALGAMVHTATEPATVNCSLRRWSYLIHGRDGTFHRDAQIISHAAAQAARKLRAIQCHKTQLKLSHARFVRYATNPEKLLSLDQERFTITRLPMAERGRGLVSQAA